MCLTLYIGFHGQSHGTWWCFKCLQVVRKTRGLLQIAAGHLQFVAVGDLLGDHGCHGLILTPMLTWGYPIRYINI